MEKKNILKVKKEQKNEFESHKQKTNQRKCILNFIKSFFTLV